MVWSRSQGPRPWCRRMLGFAGPGFLVAAGHMGPGNWGTDLAGGSRFGYALLWVILVFNLMAMLLQVRARASASSPGWIWLRPAAIATPNPPQGSPQPSVRRLPLPLGLQLDRRERRQIGFRHRG